MKTPRAVAVSTALALFATLSAAGAAVAAPAVDQFSNGRQLSSAIIAPQTTLTVTELATTGYSATVTGFRLGLVEVTLDGVAYTSIQADATGAFPFTYVGSGIALGTHTFEFSQVSSGSQSATFTLVADAVTPPPTPAPSCATVPAVITGSAPTSISLSGIRGSGYTAGATGFIPGETVDAILGTGQSGGGVGQAVVAPDCTVAYTLVDTAGLPAGDGYTLTLASTTASIAFPFSIVADAVAPPLVVAAPAAPAPTAAVRSSAPQLAATGFDPAGGMLAAAGLLAAGGAAVVFRRKLAPGRE